MTLVGKTEYTISIRITHSCMAGFFSTQIIGEILRLIRGFLFYKKNSRRARECCLQWGNEEMLESGNKRGQYFPSTHGSLGKKKDKGKKNNDNTVLKVSKPPTKSDRSIKSSQF